MCLVMKLKIIRRSNIVARWIYSILLAFECSCSDLALRNTVGGSWIQESQHDCSTVTCFLCFVLEPPNIQEHSLCSTCGKRLDVSRQCNKYRHERHIHGAGIVVNLIAIVCVCIMLGH